MDDERLEPTPVERHVKRAMIDEESRYGKPLSRRQRQTRRTLESYLRAGVVPRYMQRLREIEQERRRQTSWLRGGLPQVRDPSGGGPGEIERGWPGNGAALNFEAHNQLVREHNEWYPIE